MSKYAIAAKAVSDYADKHDITDIQSINIVRDSDELSKIWDVTGMDEFINDIAEEYSND